MSVDKSSRQRRAEALCRLGKILQARLFVDCTIYYVVLHIYIILWFNHNMISYYSKLYHIMLCYMMLHHIILYYVMLCYVVL